MSVSIPFCKTWTAPLEAEYVAQVLNGESATDGQLAESSSQLLEERLGVGRVLLTPSCTSALELAALLCELGPGDEVVMPSFTFPATANSVARTGATPVFVDVRADTMNIDEQLIPAALTERTKAIFVMHYGGVVCEMDAINDNAAQRGLVVVEDAAQGIDASYHGRAAGSLAPLAAFSFHHTKSVTCGEGGALCVNDPALLERAETIREHGTNRKQFLRGAVDKYTWVDTGTSGLLNELACAQLLAQLESLDEITTRRRAIWDRYAAGLALLEEAGVARSGRIPDGCQGNGHLFYLLVQDSDTRGRLIAYLRERGIAAVFHYVPLHSSPQGRRVGRVSGELAVTETLSERLVRLPVFHDLTVEDQQRVIDEVLGFFG